VRVETLQEAIPTIPGSVIGPFLSQPLVVEVGALDSAPAIVATEESRVIVGQGDLAYADRIGVQAPVCELAGLPPGPHARRPGHRRSPGRRSEVRRRRARAPLRQPHDARNHEGAPGDQIPRRSPLRPARETSYPSYMPRAPDKPIKATIMSVEDGVSELGQFQIITINRGASGWPGSCHVLASYRRVPM